MAPGAIPATVETLRVAHLKRDPGTMPPLIHRLWSSLTFGDDYAWQPAAHADAFLTLLGPGQGQGADGVVALQARADVRWFVAWCEEAGLPADTYASLFQMTRDGLPGTTWAQCFRWGQGVSPVVRWSDMKEVAEYA